MSVLIETSQGDVVVDLYVEERPKCAINFLKLCKIKFYNFSLFHTVQRNVLAQTGDPTGTGEGGESVWGVMKGEEYRYFEMETMPRLKHLNPGLISMVNNGKGYHGSQFVFTLGGGLDYLDGKHTVFGEVAEGMDVLTKINEAYCDKDGRPFQDIRIYHTVILEDPFSDPEGLEMPDRSPSPPKVVTDSSRIGAEEDIDEYRGLTEEEIRELVGKREAKANAQILEMVGDIPDADGKPPESVLFVCKLNPATTGEDLEIIFSRFGTILSCEVIKDQKTGDSLQYAFIEFENEDDCVSAYFKMDNVLIDDRRIHVDFSQSLAKVKGIKPRRQSEEQPANPRSRNDGFVSKTKATEDDYDMVFDESSVEQTRRSASGNSRKREVDKHSHGSRRERSSHQQGNREQSSHQQGNRERSSYQQGNSSHQQGNRERSSHQQGNRERSSHQQGNRDRSSHQQGNRQSKEKHRSRSRSREKRHKHHRDRSKSRERHRRH